MYPGATTRSGCCVASVDEGRNRAEHVPAGRTEIRLREPVDRVPEGRPWRRSIVVRGHRAGDVVRAYRDDEGVVPRRVADRGGAAAAAVVPGRCHDDDAGEPQALHGAVQRAREGARPEGGMEREVRHPNVPARLVLEDPVTRRDDVARERGAPVVHHVQRHDRRGRCRAGVATRAPGSDTGDERPVPAAVAGRVGPGADEIHLLDHPTAEIDAPASMPESTIAIVGIVSQPLVIPTTTETLPTPTAIAAATTARGTNGRIRSDRRDLRISGERDDGRAREPSRQAANRR